MRILTRLERPDYGSITPGSAADVPPGYNPRNYPKPAVTVDIAVVTKLNGSPHLLLIRRGHPPYQGFWALPGGFLEMHEDLHECAARELAEETGIDLAAGLASGAVRHFDQLRAFGRPGRDPRDRVVTVTYLAVVEAAAVDPRAGDDAADVAWAPLAVAAASDALSFDHPLAVRLVADCLEKAPYLLAP